MKEIDLLEMIFHGLRDFEIGRRLATSTRTAESHVSRINKKLGAHKRKEAVRAGLERSLIQ